MLGPHLASLGAVLDGGIGGIVPRMTYIMAIRVAEPWTLLSVVLLAALAILFIGAVFLLVRRS